MRALVILVMAMSLSGCSFALPEAKVSIDVVDENGNRIEGADIKVVFEDGNGVVRRIGKSQTNVLFEASVKVSQPFASVTVSKNGYYDSRDSYMFSGKDSGSSKLTPWNPTLPIVMRRQINMLDMQYKFVDLKRIPVFGKPIGFDLLTGDWVSPYGQGSVNDFIFQVDKEGEWVSEYKVSFSNIGDGILEYAMPEDMSSIYKWPYNAPLDGYQEVLRKVTSKHQSANKLSEHLVKKKFDTNYICRIRSKLDEQGNVVSALYGKIRGELKIYPKGGVQFHYYVNTDPASQSLESKHPTYP